MSDTTTPGAAAWAMNGLTPDEVTEHIDTVLAEGEDEPSEVEMAANALILHAGRVLWASAELLTVRSMLNWPEPHRLSPESARKRMATQSRELLDATGSIMAILHADDDDYE